MQQRPTNGVCFKSGDLMQKSMGRPPQDCLGSEEEVKPNKITHFEVDRQCPLKSSRDSPRLLNPHLAGSYLAALELVWLIAETSIVDSL